MTLRQKCPNNYRGTGELQAHDLLAQAEPEEAARLQGRLHMACGGASDMGVKGNREADGGNVWVQDAKEAWLFLHDQQSTQRFPNALARGQEDEDTSRGPSQKEEAAECREFVSEADSQDHLL